ncbi:MAG TPA: hypothetical protein VMC02_08975, partial [Steroidobacteraceae bacterium]|nr:hypothetical protein [Steroidobacteraceae bacterium]
YLFLVTTAVIGRVSHAELACCARAFDEAAPALVAARTGGRATSRSTAISCRRTKISAPLAAALRARRTSEPNIAATER